MNIEHLRYFIGLAHAGHYGRAAEALSISQPGLSHAIDALERELQAPLFQREGRGIRLSRYGRLLLPEAERMVALHDNCLYSFQHLRGGAGVIRLRTIPLVIIPLVTRLVREFQQVNPQCDFSFSTGMSGDVYQALKERRADVGFCSQTIPDPELEYVPIQRQPMIVAVPLGHPLAGREAVTLAETLPFPHVTYSWDSGLREGVDKLFAPVRERWNIAYQVEDANFIMELVAQGFGITVMPQVPPVFRPDVVVLPLTEPVWETNFHIVRRKEPHLMASVNEFFQFCLRETRH